MVFGVQVPGWRPMKLFDPEIDALNMTLNWFGGRVNRLDLFVASIDVSVIKDLEELSLLRKVFLGWEITRLGRQALIDRNIHYWVDTRV